jgi:hypothetical protein
MAPYRAGDAPESGSSSAKDGMRQQQEAAPARFSCVHHLVFLDFFADFMPYRPAYAAPAFMGLIKYLEKGFAEGRCD